ncbi:subtype B tannase, partial [Aquabacterium sp.]|uniref:subtype B tannase n=1 Tax=Aquabacterium sp. TaxID=1872578 RepID=UPI0025C0168A
RAAFATAPESEAAPVHPVPVADALRWDPTRYNPQSVTVGDQTIQVRAYEGVPVVARPIEPAYQAINLYVPEVYFHGGHIGAFDACTAPIFLPIGVGGYMPAKPGTLTSRMGPPSTEAAPTASAIALSRGFIVAAPGARGRTLQAADGLWTGKAPAAIVDLKAAVRWLRYNSGPLPGNVERIVSNGTSAGGALSALLGASGNHPDYEADLQALGAAPGRDDVFAVSAYCPITNLAHADEAYEWQFEGLREYRNVAITMLDFRVQRKEIVGRLDEAQLVLSAALRADFVAYVNQLGLRAPDGTPLTLEADGQGRLRDHITALLKAAAQRALDGGEDLAGAHWLTIQNGQIQALDFDAHVRAAGRMKSLPGFDGLALETGENQLFGSSMTDNRHFTDFAFRRSMVSDAECADVRTVRSMDAMWQIADERSTVASRWRIRHGAMDRDTSFAVPTLLAAAARQRKAAVDFALPWGLPHCGDHDLDELFAWSEGAVVSG